jgi:hypothetical protein
MHKEGTAYILKSSKENWPDFIPEMAPMTLKKTPLPLPTNWQTLFISGGRKDKISKGDIAGIFFKKAGLSAAEIGMIELKNDCAFIAIATNKVGQAIKMTNNTHLKKKKIRVTEI